MTEAVRAIRYKNLEEARRALMEIGAWDPEIFDDGGQEPQGLLAAVPQDRLPEERFYRLFELRRGILVEVEKIPYSGYGPPAQEEDYMGFVSEQLAYVLAGCRLAIEIEGCPQGARDIHHLEALVLDHQHPLDREYLSRKLGLSRDWDFEDLFQLIAQQALTGQELDRLIHQGIQ